MARAKTAQHKPTSVEQAKAEEELLHESTGVTIATPESVPAVRKKSMAGGSLEGGGGGTLLRSPRSSLTGSTEPQHMPEN